MSFLGRFRSQRHPLVEAVARAEGSRAKFDDLLRAWTTLLETGLYVAVGDDPGASRHGPTVGRLVAPDGSTVLAAFIELDAVRQQFPDATGEKSLRGAELCTMARAEADEALAVFAEGSEPVMDIAWHELTWLGAGLIPNYQRVTGAHEAIRDEALVEACRRAVDGLDENEHATVIEGVASDGVGRATLMRSTGPLVRSGYWQ